MDYIITATKTYTFHVRANTEEDAEKFVSDCEGADWEEYVIGTVFVELDTQEVGGEESKFLDRLFQEM